MRWDPARADETFFSQSAHLHIQYHTTQIMIHRPLIPVDPRVPVPFPSLAICTNAARAIIQVVEEINKRTGSPHHRNMVRQLDLIAVLDTLSCLVPSRDPYS